MKSIVIFLCLLSFSAFAFVDVTVDQVDGSYGAIAIHYTVAGVSGNLFDTVNWQYSLDDGNMWLDIDPSAISNNDRKVVGSSFIEWDTQVGGQNLTGQRHENVRFRMSVKSSSDRDLGSWRSRTRLPLERSGLGSFALAGKIYVVGGKNAGSPFSTVEAYDPQTDMWMRQLGTTKARYDLCVAEAEGRIYAIGGFTGIRPTAIVEEFDPATNTWIARSSLPTSRYGCAVAGLNGKIYTIGGQNQNGILADVEIYDPATDQWTPGTPLPAPRAHLAATVVDGQIYALGGWDEKDYLRTVETYDLETNMWEAKSGMFVRRSSFAVTVLFGKIYAIGGTNGETSSRVVESYNPPTNTMVSLLSISGTCSSTMNLGSSWLP